MKAGSDKDEKKDLEEIRLSAESPWRLQEDQGFTEVPEKECTGHFLKSPGQF